MISPTRQLAYLALFPAALTLLLYVLPAALIVVLMIDVIIVLAAMIDLFRLPTGRSLTIQRDIGKTATRGEKQRVELTAINHGEKMMNLVLRDDRIPGGIVSEDEFALQLPATSRTRVKYDLKTTRRGSYVLEHIYVRLASPWQLWSRYETVPLSSLLHVYPALSQISRYALYTRQNKMALLGVRRLRKAGTENDFERLRDYTPDDQFRSIDWRATSRRQKLTVRDFQQTQSQRLILMLDCGRMMTNEAAGESLLDGAIDAALTMAYVALSQNDQVGLLCFSDRVHRWLAPQAGRKQLNRMVHAVHDLEPRLVESRFDSAFLHLHQHCRKRTLVILVTNVTDDVNAGQVLSQAKNLVGKHLPLTVLLRDREIFNPVTRYFERQPPPASARNDIGFYRAAAAADLLLWRHQVLTELRHAGVLTLDTFATELTAPLINQYLEIKASKLL